MKKKLVKNGKVAVLISQGFGAGWSTWNASLGEAAIFDPEMAASVLAKDGKVEEIAVRKYPDAYHGGVSDLVVEWVTKGTRFEINEYDGSESLRILSPADGVVA